MGWHKILVETAKTSNRNRPQEHHYNVYIHIDEYIAAIYVQAQRFIESTAIQMGKLLNIFSFEN